MSNQSVNSSDSDDPEKLMRMDFINEMASRPQSTMNPAGSSKPPLRLEMDKYLSLNIPTDLNIENMEGEILKWWNKNRDELPLLAELAREYLCIPASSAPSERLFSHAGNIVTDTRQSLDSENVSKLLFVKENMHRCLTSWKRWKTKIPEENQHYVECEPSEALAPSQPTHVSNFIHKKFFRYHFMSRKSLSYLMF